MKQAFTLVFYIMICCHLTSQNLIVLSNPSFEDEAGHSRTPTGWTNCGPETESPPDIHPLPEIEFSFGNDFPVYHGNTYLGMVARDNNTWEIIGQKLSKPLKSNVSYQLTIHVARPQNYRSYSRKNKLKAKFVNYTNPVRLRIHGGNSSCEKGELLAETNPITEHSWTAYSFELNPLNDYSHLVLEVYNQDTVCGALLIDNCSPILKVQSESKTQNYSIEELKQLSLTCHNLINFPQKVVNYFPKTEIIRQTLLINKLVKENASTSFLRRISSDQLKRIYKSLNSIGINRANEELKKALQIKYTISKDKRLSREDKRFVSNFNQTLKTIFKEENLTTKINTYIESNLVEISKEIYYCD